LLIEVLVAVAIVILVLVGAMSLSTKSINTTKETDRKAEMSKLAQIEMSWREKNRLDQVFSSAYGDQVLECGTIIDDDCNVSFPYICTTNMKWLDNKTVKLSVEIGWNPECAGQSSQSYTLDKIVLKP